MVLIKISTIKAGQTQELETPRINASEIYDICKGKLYYLSFIPFMLQFLSKSFHNSFVSEQIIASDSHIKLQNHGQYKERILSWIHLYISFDKSIQIYLPLPSQKNCFWLGGGGPCLSLVWMW